MTTIRQFLHRKMVRATAYSARCLIFFVIEALDAFQFGELEVTVSNDAASVLEDFTHQPCGSSLASLGSSFFDQSLRSWQRCSL